MESRERTGAIATETSRKPGYLMLEDGRSFAGVLDGALAGSLPGETPGAPGVGEVVFQTGMTGYQEVITDPSYRGQIVTFTASHIGNTGVNVHDEEAAAPALAGVVVRSLAETPSNWRSEEALPAYLARHGIPCLAEVDTRALTRHLRTAGALRGVIVPGSVEPETARRRVEAWPGLVGRDLVREVIPAESETGWTGSPLLRPFAESGFADRAAYERAKAAEELAEGFPLAEAAGHSGRGKRITVVHCGMKQGIVAGLQGRGAQVRVVRPDVSLEELLRGEPDLVLLSNGPGDPDALEGLIATVRAAVGRVPLQGICLGFQVLALALGAKTRKMKFGHHGVNHPVKDLATGRVLVTSQNHGFEVIRESLPEGCTVTHESLNDGCLEGFAHAGKNIRAVQFHPEARGGPHDAGYLLEAFQSERTGHEVLG